MQLRAGESRTGFAWPLSVRRSSVLAGFLLAILALVVFPIVPYQLAIIGLLTVFFIASVISSQLALAFVAFSFSLSGIARIQAFDAPLLAGFGTILIVLLAAGLAVRDIVRPQGNRGAGVWRDTVREEFGVALLKVFLFAFTFLLCIAIAKGGFTPLQAALMIREYLVPLLLFPVTVMVVGGRVEIARMVLGAIVVGATIAALFNLYHYQFGTSLPVRQYVVHPGTSTPMVREFLGVGMPRMQHTLGLSTQGAGGAYYATLGAVAAILSAGRRHLFTQPVFFSLAVVLAAAALLTMSYSALLAWALIFGFVVLSMPGSYHSVRRILLMVVAVSAAALLLFGKLIDVGEERSLWRYAASEIASVYHRVQGMSFSEVLLGIGMGLKSGVSVGAADVAGESERLIFMVDQWLMVVFYQMGIVGFAVMVALLGTAILLAVRAYTTIEDLSKKHVVLAAGTITVGFLGFAHGAAIIERLFSGALVVALACIYMFARKDRAV